MTFRYQAYFQMGNRKPELRTQSKTKRGIIANIGRQMSGGYSGGLKVWVVDSKTNRHYANPEDLLKG